MSLKEEDYDEDELYHQAELADMDKEFFEMLDKMYRKEFKWVSKHQCKKGTYEP